MKQLNVYLLLLTKLFSLNNVGLARVIEVDEGRGAVQQLTKKFLLCKSLQNVPIPNWITQ